MPPALSVFPQGLSRHFEFKEESPPILPSPYLSHFPSFPTWAGNSLDKGKVKGTLPPKQASCQMPGSSLSLDAYRPWPWVASFPFPPHSPCLPPFLKASSSSQSHFIPSVFPPRHEILIQAAPPIPATSSGLSPRGEQKGGAQVRRDRDPAGICLTAPSLLDFGYQGGSKNSLFSGLPSEQLCPGLSLSFFHSFSPSQTVARKHPRTDQGSHP